MSFERAISLCGNELKHGATLERRLERVPPVLGDESRLVQVLMNLLINAAQASHGPASDHHVTVESSKPSTSFWQRLRYYSASISRSTSATARKAPPPGTSLAWSMGG